MPAIRGKAAGLASFVGVLLALACVVDWLFPLDESNLAKRMIPHLLRLMVLSVLVGYCALRLRVRDLSRSNLILCAMLFAGMVLLHFVVKPHLNYFLTLTLAKHMYWIAGLVAYYLMTLRNEITQRQTTAIVSILLLVTSVHSIGEWFVTRSLYRNSDAYLILWFIPLLLLEPRPKTRSVVLVLLGTFAIAFTMKRGASIAMVLSMLVFLGVKTKLDPKAAKRYFGLACLLMLTMGVMYLWRWDDTVARWAAPGASVNRLTSGRALIYGTVLQGWQEGGVPRQVIGAGFYSVEDFLGESTLATAIYAHSDWLEILYDYGAVGVILFACFHASILALVIKMFRFRHPCTPALAMGYTVFFLVSIYSGSTMFHQTIFFSWLIAHGEAQRVLVTDTTLGGYRAPW